MSTLSTITKRPAPDTGLHEGQCPTKKLKLKLLVDDVKQYTQQLDGTPIRTSTTPPALDIEPIDEKAFSLQDSARYAELPVVENASITTSPCLDLYQTIINMSSAASMEKLQQDEATMAKVSFTELIASELQQREVLEYIEPSLVPRKDLIPVEDLKYWMGEDFSMQVPCAEQ